jgi:hypothetical protein
MTTQNTMTALEYMNAKADPEAIAAYLGRFHLDSLPQVLCALVDGWLFEYHSLPEVQESVQGFDIDDLLRRGESDKASIRQWLIDAGLNAGVDALKSF